MLHSYGNDRVNCSRPQTGRKRMLSNRTMQNTPAELTRLIEPIEQYLVTRLVHSLELQSTLMKEVQQHVQGGQSACLHEAVARIERLHALQRLTLNAYERIAYVGDWLYQLQKHDPDGHPPAEEVPF